MPKITNAEGDGQTFASPPVVAAPPAPAPAATVLPLNSDSDTLAGGVYEFIDGKRVRMGGTVPVAKPE